MYWINKLQDLKTFPTGAFDKKDERINRSKNTGLFIFAGIVLAIKNLDWSFLTITKPAKRMLEEYWFSKGKIREYNEVRVDFIDMKDLYEKLRKVHEVE